MHDAEGSYLMLPARMCSLQTVSAIMPAWNFDRNRGTILAWCCLLALSSCCYFHTAYTNANTLCILAQDLLMSFVTICVSPMSAVSFALQTVYESAVSYVKQMMGDILSLLPCPYPEKGYKNNLVVVHSPAFGGRGMFVTAGVSSVRSNIPCCLQLYGVAIIISNAFWKDK